ncbi:MAG: methyltransferase domain-containing protein [Hyphomonadaceae bacterium]|nr:methyltransferase domain-containing protein [Hyphomonadaceae bacterium]
MADDQFNPSIQDAVRAYYGKTLSHSDDLQTDACCTPDSMPNYAKPLMADIHDEVMARYYGCGLVLPEVMSGLRVLDLGCGAGRDCYVISRLVGETGAVVGVDMTDEQLDVAARHVDYHREKYGYATANTTFLKGDIERLQELDLADQSFDLIVSNCVINLTQDKAGVLAQAYRLLKPGGEMYFSDVYCDRRLDPNLSNDPVLHGECLAGALYWNDFENLAKRVGFGDPRVVEQHPLGIQNPDIQRKLGAAKFYSVTYRLMKIDELEPACEDYGQAVRYKGTVETSPDIFVLDDHHKIEAGRIFLVCGNTYRMLNQTRFAAHFEFFGTWDTHYGLFKDCGEAPREEEVADGVEGCC